MCVFNEDNYNSCNNNYLIFPFNPHASYALFLSDDVGKFCSMLNKALVVCLPYYDLPEDVSKISLVSMTSVIGFLEY